MGGEWWGESGHLVRSVPLVVSFPPKMMECLLRWPERWAGSDTCTGGLIWMRVGGALWAQSERGDLRHSAHPAVPMGFAPQDQGRQAKKGTCPERWGGKVGGDYLPHHPADQGKPLALGLRPAALALCSRLGLSICALEQEPPGKPFPRGCLVLGEGFE